MTRSGKGAHITCELCDKWRRHLVMLIKLLLVGDTEVGKSFLLNRFASPDKSIQCFPSSTPNFIIKYITIDETSVKLQVWDSPGQEKFQTIVTPYFRNAQGILLMYDVSNRKSFTAVRKWMERIQMHAHPDVPKLLVGNKCELNELRSVGVEEGTALAAEYQMEFMETSAKENINVDECFLALGKASKDRLQSETHPVNDVNLRSFPIRVNEERSAVSSTCYS